MVNFAYFSGWIRDQKLLQGIREQRFRKLTSYKKIDCYSNSLYAFEMIKSVANTGWPKSNVSKVRAYCSASDHLIRKIFSGLCRDSHRFEEYLKIIWIGVHFFEWTFIFRVFHPFNMPGSPDNIPIWLLLSGLSRYKYTIKIRALICPALDIYSKDNVTNSYKNPS